MTRPQLHENNTTPPTPSILKRGIRTNDLSGSDPSTQKPLQSSVESLAMLGKVLETHVLVRECHRVGKSGPHKQAISELMTHPNKGRMETTVWGGHVEEFLKPKRWAVFRMVN